MFCFFVMQDLTSCACPLLLLPPPPSPPPPPPNLPLVVLLPALIVYVCVCVLESEGRNADDTDVLMIDAGDACQETPKKRAEKKMPRAINGR